MLDRFDNIPDMLELDHLTVSGDVTFGKNVTLKVSGSIILGGGGGGGGGWLNIFKEMLPFSWKRS